MKLLTIKINNNILETLDFERAKFTNSFILPSDTRVDLIKIPLENSVGNKSEKGVFIQDTRDRKCFFPCKLVVSKTKYDEESLIDHYEVEIEFDTEPRNRKAFTDETNSNSQFVFHEGILEYKNVHTDRVSDIKVTITLNDGEDRYSVYRTIFLSPANQVEDVILDFGSEATQLSISNRGSINNVNNLVSLFDLMWEDLGETNKQNDIDICMQHDASDENLYRSRFFVKKKIEHSLLQETKASGNPKDNKFIKLLTLSNEGESLKEHFIPLPNTKIASFGGVTVDKVDIEIEQNNGQKRIKSKPITSVGENFFYRSSINAFLRKAVDEIGINNKIESESSKKVRLISFHILMPNVYDYCKIHDMLNVLKKDIQEIIHEVDSDIIGFDVSAVSESDASLLGNVALSKPSDFPAGRYLILDAGRGTLDFSIVKHDNKSKYLHFQNLYRDGIIGAGNALTYAMLLVILEGIVSTESAGVDHTEEIRNYIFSNILGLDELGKQNGGGDSAKLVELMELLDRYKIMYPDFLSNKTSGSTKSLTISNSFKDLRLEGLVKKIHEIIDNNIYIEDGEKYLERSMRQLVDAVIGRLKDRFSKDGDTNTPDYVVFAGRGFMFQPFKTMMEERLIMCFPQIEKKHFSTRDNNVSDKNVCLVIANYLKDGDYDTRLLGQPYMLHSEGSRTRTNRRDVIQQTDNTSRVGKIIHFFRTFSRSIGDNSEVYDILGGGVIDKGYRAHQDMNWDNFNKGVTLHAQYSNDQILIGNIRHKLPNMVDLDRDFDLFFANGIIWIRPEGGKAVLLDKGIDFGGNRIFESLFPYVTISRAEKVAIPNALDEDSTYVIPETDEDVSPDEEHQNDGDDLLI